jgi:hypothetical protein
MPQPADTSAELRRLADELERFTTRSVDARELVTLVQCRLRDLALQARAPHCARCRRDVSTELRLQAWMN